MKTNNKKNIRRINAYKRLQAKVNLLTEKTVRDFIFERELVEMNVLENRIAWPSEIDKIRNTRPSWYDEE